MSRYPSLISLAGFLLYCSATNSAFAAKESNCGDLQITAEILACQGREFEKLDKELNRIWKKFITTIPAEGSTDEPRRERPQYIAAQKAWLQYRDTSCAVEGGEQGGASQWVSIFQQTCVLEMTKERIKYLGGKEVR